MPGKVPASNTPRRTRSSRKPAALRTVARSMEHNPHRVTVTASHTGAPTLACIAHHQPLVCGLTVPETLQPHLRLCCIQHGICRGASWTLPGLCLQTPPKPSKLRNPTEQLGWDFRPPAHVCSAGKYTRKIVINCKPQTPTWPAGSAYGRSGREAAVCLQTDMSIAQPRVSHVRRAA